MFNSTATLPSRFVYGVLISLKLALMEGGVQLADLSMKSTTYEHWR
jgi:hypothetical protein